ncbi:MAG: DEAD/DEAH box helicase [Actinomycetota bacterium]|nr:DEAD/DEAH box helicase [Actinomycetota bacterium]
MSTFADLGVSAPVFKALAREDIHVPFQIQGLVMADALSGRDVLAKSRTGSGKTLAFAIPIVERVKPGGNRPKALVLVPTRELCVQVTDDFRGIARAMNLRVASVYGGTALREQSAKAAKADIVVATPGRLEDISERKLIKLDSIEILVLDEADRMLDMGFQPQVDRLVRRIPKQRQTMFFSATLDGRVGYMAKAYTSDPVKHEVVDKRQTVEEAEHRFVPVNEHNKVEKLIELLGEERDLTLVFVRTKRGADRLTQRLKQRGVTALAMHGDLSQGQRRRALSRFESGAVDVLVATDVAARGLDLDDITHVINYDPPQDHKDYVHRIGRTARAGRSGTGVTLVTSKQQADVSIVASELNLKVEFEAEGLKVAKPRRVFTSGRRGSFMSPPRRRRV